LFLGGPEWPFRIAAMVCILAAIEELLLTLILAKPESNVRSIWLILKRHRH